MTEKTTESVHDMANSLIAYLEHREALEMKIRAAYVAWSDTEDGRDAINSRYFEKIWFDAYQAGMKSNA